MLRITINSECKVANVQAFLNYLEAQGYVANGSIQVLSDEDMTVLDSIVVTNNSVAKFEDGKYTKLEVEE